MLLCPKIFDQETYDEKKLNLQIMSYKLILREKGEEEGNKFLDTHKLTKE